MPKTETPTPLTRRLAALARELEFAATPEKKKEIAEAIKATKAVKPAESETGD